jgi:cell volume regulation protein A
MFVARPAAVVACLAPFGYRRAGDRLHRVDRIARRGRHLPRVDPLLAGLPNATVYFNVAFVVVFAR